MFTVYPTKMKSMLNMHKKFETEAEAKAYVSTRNNPANYTIEGEVTKQKEPKQKTKKVIDIDFTDATQITRDNVRFFYNKEGYIKVVNQDGTILHIGKTKNMGKVFSNYVNCAKYNQSYDFNLEGGDKLFFVETKIQ